MATFKYTLRLERLNVSVKGHAEVRDVSSNEEAEKTLRDALQEAVFVTSISKKKS